jgi:uncharacterized protein (DUF362 family)
VDALRGILDYLAPRFKGPVIVGEAATGDTMQFMERGDFPKLITEFKDQKVSLLDFNQEAKFVVQPLLDYNLHVVPARLAARLFDPDAFIFSAGIMKTHNVAVATLTIKNLTLGAPLHYVPGDKTKFNDKRKMHAGVRQTNYLMYLLAAEMKPYWGVGVIDGFVGMEGNGPGAGTPVQSRIAIASTDYVAADRVGVEAMGIDAGYLGALNYLGSAGFGQWDLAKINLVGPPIASVQKKYRLHSDIERELQWRGPMMDLPPNIGWTRPIDPERDIVV